MTRILWVATKPAWPPTDGGRLVMWRTIEALAAAGHHLTFVSPVYGREALASESESAAAALRTVCTPVLVPAHRPRALPVLLRALASSRPLSIVRHSSPDVRALVDALLAEGLFDVVHAEQLQALPQCEGAARHGVPVVLRAQNVESDLWRDAAFARWEARRVASWEGAAVRRAAATIALTAEDAEALQREAGPEAKVEPIPAPFPAELSAGRALAGEPALVVLAGGEWKPNRSGALWFRSEVWPALRSAMPEARLHLFGIDDPAPDESAAVFAEGSILLVPLHVASGVRMKILEAWARGVPVVATRTAARGLGDDPPLLAADTPADFVSAIRRLADDRVLRASLVEGGRKRLRDAHDPARIAARIAEVYQRAPRMGAARVRSTIETSTAVE